MSGGQPEILCERRGAAGWVTLNRPRALNALTHGMVRVLSDHLKHWRDDPQVERVVVTAAGDRAFCAGGDIRALTELGRAGRHHEALAFWRDEYILNATIKTYPKPYVSLIDGIVMGGGFGISVHGSRRVAGDRFLFAMPEVGIGFFPDVGGTFFLPRMPQRLGVWLALTGERLAASDAVAATVATHRVPSDRMSELADALCERGDTDAMLVRLASASASDTPRPEWDAVERLFAGQTVTDILVALDRAAARGGADAAFAERTAATIRMRSPSSLTLAMRQMLLGPGLDFAGCLKTEFRIVSRIIYGHDFYEGVRAALIDKDNNPSWDPPSLDQVKGSMIDAHFADLGADELRLP